MSGAVEPAEAVPSLLRLRPSVHVSPTRDGIYVRGWTTAFTVGGGVDLWRLWQRLAPALRHGVAVERLEAAAARGTLLNVVRELVRALREHDMTLSVAAGWRGDAENAPPALAADWLDQLSGEPGPAWRRLAASTVDVDTPGATESPIADAAMSALVATGVRASHSAGVAVRDSAVVALTVGSSAVFAGMDEHTGFVTYATTPAEGAQLASRVATRLGIACRPADATPAHQPLAAILGSTAAERLLRAVAGLADPGDGAITEPAAPAEPDSAGNAAPADSWPMILVARARPFVAAYHPWLAGGGGSAGPTEDFEVVLARLDALCDAELGVLPAPRSDDLPQVPAALAVCEAGGRRVLGAGERTSTARLDAALRAAERLLDPDGTCRLAVGVDDVHAQGRQLRGAAYEVAGRAAAIAADPGTEHGWPDSPAARRWWTTLTVRCGLDARCGLARLADGVFAARVELAGRELAWAVEASAGTAVAHAALGAVAAYQASRAGLGADAPVTVCPAVSVQPSGGGSLGRPAVEGRAPRLAAERQLLHGLRQFVPRGQVLRRVPPGRHEVRLALGAAGFSVWELR